jgi:hypothetical protein
LPPPENSRALLGDLGALGVRKTGPKEVTMQLKLFDRKLSELGQLEAAINQWLKENPKLVTIQRDFHIYHNHTTKEECLLVALWYEPKSTF